MRFIAILTLALTGVLSPAFAQDRTPPDTDLRVYAPPIDWSASQTHARRSDFYGLANDAQTTPRRAKTIQMDGR